MEMKRQKVIISKKAQQSIKNIYEYIKKEVSNQTALYVKNGILQKCKSLKEFAGYSKERYLTELGYDYRSVTQWNYVIIYRCTKKDVIILNIIHAGMHPEKRKNL